MIGKIGPVDDQNYEICNYTVFLGKSSLCIYTRQSLLIINLHEQQASEFVQFSDLAKFWHF